MFKFLHKNDIIYCFLPEQAFNFAIGSKIKKIAGMGCYFIIIDEFNDMYGLRLDEEGIWHIINQGKYEEKDC